MMRKYVRRNPVVVLPACVTGLLVLLSVFVIGGRQQLGNATNPPADMLHWLRDILDDDVAAWTVINRQYMWFEGGLVIAVTDGYGQSVMLFTDGNDVVRTNCPDGLPYINKILAGLEFPESNFQDWHQVRLLLENVVDLYHGPGGMVATRAYLKGIESVPSGIQAWLKKPQTDPNEFRKIWIDPQATLAGDEWSATFNYLKHDGSVEQWLVSGEFDRAAQRVEVASVRITTLKEKGFHRYPIVPPW